MYVYCCLRLWACWLVAVIWTFFVVFVISKTLLQTVAEISFIWRPKCLVTLLNLYDIQINLSIYIDLQMNCMFVDKLWLEVLTELEKHMHRSWQVVAWTSLLYPSAMRTVSIHALSLVRILSLFLICYWFSANFTTFLEFWFAQHSQNCLEEEWICVFG